MYNRYIPEDVPYIPVEAPPVPDPRAQVPQMGQPRSIRLPDFLTGKEGVFRLLGGGEKGGLSGLLKALRLDHLDSGDILLLLIMLYLLVEGEDLDLAIALGLVILMDFWDNPEK